MLPFPGPAERGLGQRNEFGGIPGAGNGLGGKSERADLYRVFTGLGEPELRARNKKGSVCYACFGAGRGVGGAASCRRALRCAAFARR